MIEADVSMGTLTTNNDSSIIPIMAHPPHKTSDLSLEQFLTTILESGKRKGIKLDFKDIDIVEPALVMLKRQENQVLASPLILTRTAITSSAAQLTASIWFLCEDYSAFVVERRYSSRSSGCCNAPLGCCPLSRPGQAVLPSVSHQRRMDDQVSHYGQCYWYYWGSQVLKWSARARIVTAILAAPAQTLGRGRGWGAEGRIRSDVCK